MDSSWAVVIGALIGVVGSAIVPFFLRRAERREEREVARRAATAAAVKNFITATEDAPVHIAPDTPRSDRVAVLKNLDSAHLDLAVLLRKGDSKLTTTLTRAVAASLESGRATPKLQAALREALISWQVGQLTSDEAADYFERHCGIDFTIWPPCTPAKA